MKQQVKVYASEIEAGIGQLVSESNSIACECLIINSEKSENKTHIKASANYANPDQPDLYYLKSVLASTGWNNNDDVFTREYMLKASKTPVDKQFNYMHDEKDIIGHITGSYIANFNNEPVESTEGLDGFNIITSAVMYTVWSDKDLQERCNRIIEEIAQGSWKVSMECIFHDFDYSLKTSDGTEKIITRDEKTSYMSKHLRSYGGDGVYQGYKIGRVLKDFVFSGKGLVNRPANPKSLIIETQEEANKENDEILTESLAGEKYMDEINKELENVKAQLAEAQSLISTLTEFKTKAETLEKTIADLSNEHSASKSELEQLKSSLASIQEEKDKVVAAYETMKKEVKNSKRKAALVEAEVNESEVDSTLASFESLSDEAFEAVVAMVKKTAKKGMKEEKEEKMEAKSEETVELVVETPKATASLNDISDNNKNSLRTQLVEAFSQKLKTVKNK